MKVRVTFEVSHPARVMIALRNHASWIPADREEIAETIAGWVIDQLTGLEAIYEDMTDELIKRIKT